MTFAFGMQPRFQKAYERDDDVLRFARMEKEGAGRGLEQGKIDIGRIRRRSNVVVAVGNRIETNSFDRWLAERTGVSAAMSTGSHTKFMLVDPLGATRWWSPGSADFSEPSTDENNEDMLVIRGDRRIADIYLGEFMRLHSHYAFREAVKIALERGEAQWRLQHLTPDASWQQDYFTPGHQRYLRRRYFAGARSYHQSLAPVDGELVYNPDR